MKSRFLAGVAIAAIMGAGSAFAADMPMKAAPMVVAPYDWSGIYIGGVIGGAWGRTDTSDPGLGLIGTLINVPVIQTTDASGFIGGIEGGDRYQFGKLVIGWEADMVWGNLNGTSTTNFGPGLSRPASSRGSINVNNKWTGTATSSVGIAHDRWLVYGKAGVAWTHNDYTDNWTVVGIPLFSGTGSEDTGSAGPLERASNGRSGTTGRSRPSTTTSTSATRPWPSTAPSCPGSSTSRPRSAWRTRSTSTSSRPV